MLDSTRLIFVGSDTRLPLHQHDHFLMELCFYAVYMCWLKLFFMLDFSLLVSSFGEETTLRKKKHRIFSKLKKSIKGT